MNLTSRYRRRAQMLLAVPLIFVASQIASGDDWPQWMGPNRDGQYRETGLVEKIPEGGLPVKWRVPVSYGYSGPAVADGKVFVTDYIIESGTSKNNPGGRDKLQGTERLLCFDANTGQTLWKVEYQRPYNLYYAKGPRATPTIDGKNVYALGAEGDLLCVDINDGNTIWRKQLAEEYSSQPPIWGHSAHPLVHKDLVICLAGGEGSVVVALDKRTGEERWRAISAAEIGYCPPNVLEIGNKSQLITWDSDALHGLNPETGEEYWSYPLKPRYAMAIAAPQLTGNRLFATGIGETAAMIEFDSEGKPSKTLWKGKPKIGIYSGNATCIFTKDAIYGSDCGIGQFMAIDPASGERLWETFKLTTGGTRRAGHGTAFCVQNGDRFLLFTETGELVLANFSRDGFTENGRMKVLEATNECFGRDVVWSHPAFASKSMFARNDKELVCVDLAKP